MEKEKIIRIDCRGMACPNPVLETKKALEKSGRKNETFLVLVDNLTARENVRRFAESQGHQVAVLEEKGIFYLKVERGKKKEEMSKGEEEEIAKAPLAARPFVVFLDSDSLGRGSEELGKILMRSCLHVLEELSENPQKVILMNSGVKLACEGSAVLENLQEMSRKGVEILACGTCLDYFKLKEKLQVGKISNMYEILTSFVQAGKVLKI